MEPPWSEWPAHWGGREILIVGDVMLDAYVHGEARRLSPEAPVPVIEVQRRDFRPGGAGNVAANVVALGGAAHLVGVVGADAAAVTLQQELERDGLEASGLVVDVARPTTTKTRILASGRQVARLDEESTRSLSPALEESLLARVAARMPTAAGCILSDYRKGTVTPRVAREVIALARRAGVPVVVDPKAADPTPFQGATVLKPNRAEASILVGRPLSEREEILAAGRQLVERQGGAVLLTLGAEGMLLCRPAQPPLDIPALPRSVFDVTGAGDTVAAVLGLALAAGASLEVGARLANAAAAVVVGKVGTATVRPEELSAALAAVVPIAVPEQGNEP